MAQKPKLIDYVSIIMQLFEQFMQHHIPKQGVKQMQFCSIYAFKAQQRWRTNHPEVLQLLGRHNMK